MSETRKHLSDCVWAGQPLSAAMSCHCTATPPTPESDAHREVRKSVVCEKCYGLTSCWCPPTPDRAPVRTVLVQLLNSTPITSNDLLAALSNALLGTEEWNTGHIADALLAAVSRTAEARGEPEVAQWQWYSPDEGWMNCDYPWVEQMRELGLDQRYEIRALYAHPAPSGGEGDAECASQAMTARVSRALAAQVRSAPRPETGEVSEAMVEAAAQRIEARLDSGQTWDAWSLARAALAAREGA